MKSLVKIIQTRPAVFLLALVPLFACTSSDAPLPLGNSGAERFEVNVQLPVNAYFGDLHVHSALSPDAYIQGTRATVDDATVMPRARPSTMCRAVRFKRNAPSIFWR